MHYVKQLRQILVSLCLHILEVVTEHNGDKMRYNIKKRDCTGAKWEGFQSLTFALSYARNAEASFASPLHRTIYEK